MTKIGFQDQLSLNAGQKYCRMLYFRLFLSGRFTQVLLYTPKVIIVQE